MKHFQFVYIILFILIGNITFAGELNRLWGDLVKKYPPPEPTIKERQYLERKYHTEYSMYPDQLFHNNNVQFEQVKKYASYLRKHDLKFSKSSYCTKRLHKFKDMIHKASIYFTVPEKIIGAVILQESSGNPRAKAKTSSAKGLMQTIDATFNLAKRNVQQYGLHISDPYKPKDSIIAGTWYLSYVFELARQDFPAYYDRSKLNMWEKALEYYYAGPKWGKNPKPIFHVYVKGKKLVIKKALYSQKALEYAYLL